MASKNKSIKVLSTCLLKLDKEKETNMSALSAFGNKPPQQMGHRFINNGSMEKISSLNSSLDLKNSNFPKIKSIQNHEINKAVNNEKEKILQMIESNKIMA